MEGTPAVVAGQVAQRVNSDGLALFSASADVLVYATGQWEKSRMTWMGRDGKRFGVAGSAEEYAWPRLLPDGSSVVFRRAVSGNNDVWRYDFGRDVMTRLTFNPQRDSWPAWSPDGSSIAFTRCWNRECGLYVKKASGGGDERAVLQGRSQINHVDWSRAGTHLLYSEFDRQSNWDLWVLPLESQSNPIPIVQTPFREVHGRFSPDGKWIAYVSDESGRPEVYLQHFPATGARWQISNDGGVNPRWRGDGRELLYHSRAGKVMAVEVRTDNKNVETGSPQELFDVQAAREWDVTADGQRFLVLLPDDEKPEPLTAVINWQAGLKQ